LTPYHKFGHYYFLRNSWYYHGINRRGRRVNKPCIEKSVFLTIIP
jgi:hypothetical protein